jgi:aspartokinase-like uncharacterized kinase
VRLVVKVGGSLYDHPLLGPGLRAWLAGRPERVTLVPGGGAFADAVRHLDRVHGLAEAVSHHLSLASLAPAAAFLRHLVGDAAEVLDATAFLAGYPHPVSESWDFTTDSLAACVAHDFGGDLILLKSIDVPADWSAGVDPLFTRIVARHGVRATAVNFREILDAG